ncbi:fatty acid desaturase family protein [Alloalcanivorax xenomutans]|jgi:NADPH-dependent stearoyl-CoA 9-desaturase|uniref:Acyl-CoA desaturase n=1 Tax=Alloalcanivorax xenomutans TaxID=1094342 RepID=A0A9Q3W8E4_9GAMM|nr:acyl-CoA desaturase [Alloalcanivorax xenomutans]KYZ87226.1 fatty acid desaturase [Alcanivorax sp. KX64203]MBA4722867.1 acyl-CoA desaturase [Alcanivorax sp.]ARB45164.1 fatty acid desaturase [Alloalcanivorax xenomutans]MCE7510910.1 acyl-CoA desaturase [Alloalcanivorax xenomutans]MCE7522497.1 acyl-CoA desaturase [Alloalcanivorax xenomutans]
MGYAMQQEHDPIVFQRDGVSLTRSQVDAFGEEIEALRQQVMADRGEADARYIRRVVRFQKGCEVAGRGLLFLGFLPPAWLAGTGLLALSKILENMEIGHNVMHGQWDWLGDPNLDSAHYDWDNTCPAEQWKHSHNYMHHTYTNVVGKDRDVGYGIMRMSEHQSWNPAYLFQPIYNWVLALLFEWGVAFHDLEIERVIRGDKSREQYRKERKLILKKVRRQVLKDYVLFPLLAGPFFLFVLSGNFTANILRNLWSYLIIFCGHFTERAEMFTEEEVEDESRGQWYLRQLLGSSNLEGGRLFHILSGNLSHQIEHHLFPDMPSNRYQQVAPKVREIAERYGLHYNSGSLRRQFGSVMRRIHRLALPSRRGAAAVS